VYSELYPAISRWPFSFFLIFFLSIDKCTLFLKIIVSFCKKKKKKKKKKRRKESP
jgi:hypothetical protein